MAAPPDERWLLQVSTRKGKRRRRRRGLVSSRRPEAASLAPPAPPYASSLSVPSAGLRGSFFAGVEHPPRYAHPLLPNRERPNPSFSYLAMDLISSVYTCLKVSFFFCLFVCLKKLLGVYTIIHVYTPMSFHLVGPSPSPFAPVQLRRQQRTFLQGCIDLVLLFLAQHLVYCSTLTPDLFFCRTAGTALVIASPCLSLLQQLEAEAFTRSWGSMGRSCYRIWSFAWHTSTGGMCFFLPWRCSLSCCSSFYLWNICLCARRCFLHIVPPCENIMVTRLVITYACVSVQRCIRTNSRSLLRGAASICRPIPASGRDQIMHPGLRLQLISTGRCSRAQCFVLLCGRRSMRQLR